jgi:hypothetical protein
MNDALMPPYNPCHRPVLIHHCAKVLVAQSRKQPPQPFELARVLSHEGPVHGYKTGLWGKARQPLSGRQEPPAGGLNAGVPATLLRRDAGTLLTCRTTRQTGEHP